MIWHAILPHDNCLVPSLPLLRWIDRLLHILLFLLKQPAHGDSCALCHAVLVLGIAPSVLDFDHSAILVKLRYGNATRETDGNGEVFIGGLLLLGKAGNPFIHEKVARNAEQLAETLLHRVLRLCILTVVVGNAAKLFHHTDRDFFSEKSYHFVNITSGIRPLAHDPHLISNFILCHIKAPFKIPLA